MLGSRTPDARDDQALIILAGLVGAMLLARTVDDPALSDRILSRTRKFYQEVFTGSTGESL